MRRPANAVLAPSRRERLVERITFSARIRSTTATINRLCSEPFSKAHLFLDGHVGGVKNLVYDKAIDMALLYRAICSAKSEDRLVALARLRDEAYNYQGLEMPFNARRILIALVKETVKARGVLSLQHRYVAAFEQALSGRAYVVRRMLDELGLAEVPESTGSQVEGWDDQVYDNAGPGRKTPAQLVLDAYVKGISRLTIVYEDLLEREALEEAVEAGRIMGIKVSIGIECLVQAAGKRRFFHVLLLEGCSSQTELAALLEAPATKRLLELVQGNYAEYDRLYAELIRAFNKKSLPIINEGFEGTQGEMSKLSVESLRAQARGKFLFHAHLGQLLHRRLSKLREARLSLRPEDGKCLQKAAELRERFFDPLYREILERGDFVKAEELYAAVAEVEAELGARRIRVAFVKPLEDGLDACVRQLLENAAHIDALEIWSNRARGELYPQDARFLEALRRELNTGDAEAACSLLAKRGIADVPPRLVSRAAQSYRGKSLEARIGSHSDGYGFAAPGMGFVPRDELRNWRALLWTNRSSPLPVTLPRQGRPEGRVIIPLGKDRGAARRPRAVTQPISVLGRWGDLNSTLRDIARMASGALLSLLAGSIVSLVSGFPPSFGLFAIGVFFLVTYMRNFVVDEIASHGLHPSRWRLSSFDSANAANSVFFTFLSIPLLRLVEQLLDRFAFGGAAAGLGDLSARFVRFIPLALVNGTYIYCHNSLRGFTRPVKRANFLRSALAFFLAIGLSYLNPWPLLVTGVVINKVASDIVAGFTESTFKIRNETKRARKLYASILPLLAAEARSPREKYLQRIAILDVLYVWGNSPRGKDALGKAIESESSARRIWDRLETPVHKYESFVKLITGKTAWRKPRRIKLEFLRLAAAFSYWLERNRPDSSGY